MKRVIHVTVRDKIATAPKEALYVCGNSDYSIQFDFDEEWLEYTHKTARFNCGPEPIDVVFSGNICPVPKISNVTHFYVGAYAGDLRTTTPAYVSAKKSILCGSGSPKPPTPDVYAQIMEILNKLKTEIPPEQIEAAVNAWLEDNPVEPGATEEQAEQIQKNKEDIEELKKNGTGGGISQETDPTVPSWAKQPSKPTYTAGEVGADPAGTATAAIGEHNVSGDAHEDIRQLIIGLTNRLNALADSDDMTLDQLSEIVAYIKSNKSLIDAITTGKISTTDIVDNLVTNVSSKVLSAAQGVVLKGMIDTAVKSLNEQIAAQKEANDAQDEAIAKKLDASELPTAINTALAQAKESGQFDGAPGAPGYTPQKGVDYFDGKDGEPGDPGEPGKDYVLTEADKEEIAEMAAEKVEVPEGGGSYTLPIASPDVLGGVKPAAKTDSMTQEIGVDADGKLWGLPGGGGRNWELIADITLTELVRMIEITKDLDGNPFSLSEIVIDASTKQERADGEDFTGNRNLQVIINSGGAGWFNLKFSSGTEFVPFFAHYQAIGGVVFGYAKRTVEKVAASYSSKVEANAVNTQRADAINSISIDSEYIHVNGTQNRFSLGTSVKIYGVRT